MFFGENRAPLRNEFLTIDYLKMLDAAGCVTTRGDALIVHHARHGLVNHFVAERAHAKAEIDIFVIRGRKPAIESTELLEDFFSY